MRTRTRIADDCDQAFASRYLHFSFETAAMLGQCAKLCLEAADDVSILEIDDVGAS